MSYAYIIHIIRRTFSTSSPRTLKSLSQELYKEQDLKTLVEKFKKISENGRFRTKRAIYENTIHRLAIAKQFNYIEEILEDQKKYKEISTEGFNARLITLYGKSCLFDHAYKVFDEMPERNCKRTVLSLNALLAACVYAKKFDLIDGLFRDLPKKLGIDTDSVSYNTVMKGFCEMGLFDKCVLLLNEMDEKGIYPNLVSYTTLLNGFYGKGRFLVGENIWSRMVMEEVKPDIRSYNARLLGLALQKRMSDAVKFFDEMESKEIKPDVISFNCMIRGFVNVNDLEEVKCWHDKLWKSDCKPDKLTFEMLIPYACENGDWAFAFQLSKEVFKRKRLIDNAVVQHVVDELVKDSKVDEAEELVQLGNYRKNGYRTYKLQLPCGGSWPRD